MSRADRFRVLLIRSGATEWDEQEYLPGVADLPLSQGERENLGIDESFLVSGQISSICSAGDEASIETAAIVGKILGMKPKKCSGLGDVDLGLWQGLRMSELRERTPKIYRQWIDEPLCLQPPEGESLRGARDRLVEQIFKALEKAAKSAKSEVPTVAIVLRPIALSLVRAKLLADASLAGWSRVGVAPRCEWHEISTQRAEALRSVPAGTA